MVALEDPSTARQEMRPAVRKWLRNPRAGGFKAETQAAAEKLAGKWGREGVAESLGQNHGRGWARMREDGAANHEIIEIDEKGTGSLGQKGRILTADVADFTDGEKAERWRQKNGVFGSEESQG